MSFRRAIIFGRHYLGLSLTEMVSLHPDIYWTLFYELPQTFYLRQILQNLLTASLQLQFFS